jgi:NAD-dependent SIR2 family protein deacetylase
MFVMKQFCVCGDELVFDSDYVHKCRLKHRDAFLRLRDILLENQTADDVKKDTYNVDFKYGALSKDSTVMTKVYGNYIICECINCGCRSTTSDRIYSNSKKYSTLYAFACSRCAKKLPDSRYCFENMLKPSVCAQIKFCKALTIGRFPIPRDIRRIIMQYVFTCTC